MIFLKFFERIYHLILGVSWRFLLLVFVVFFLGSWLSMATFEGEAPIAKKEVFWWYFIVTSTTVGYGDFSPATLGGRITGAFIMLVGIGLVAAIITRVAEAVLIYSKKKMNGQLELHVINHIIILGYQRGATETLVKEILADTPEQNEIIVLCSHSISENPLPGKIEFVQGNPSHDDTLMRACIRKAKRIIVYGTDDNKTVSYGIAANHHARKDAHIAAFFRDRENVENLKRVNPHIECISSLAAQMLVHAIQDPGTTGVIENLVSNEDKGTAFRLYLPPRFPTTSFLHLLCRFKELYNATLIGVSDSHGHDTPINLNPAANSRVMGGMSLFYIADARLNGEIRWFELAQGLEEKR